MAARHSAKIGPERNRYNGHQNRRLIMHARSKLLIGIVTAVLTMSAAVAAQTWPTKPLRLLVPFPPGGVTDAFARIVSTKLGAALGQPVVIDNRPGGSTIIATREVVQATPDGYTLLVGVTQLAINPAMQGDLPYDALKQLE